MNGNFADIMVLTFTFAFCVIVLWDVIIDTIEIKKSKAAQKSK